MSTVFKTQAARDYSPAHEVVEYVGWGLGNLIYRTYSGTIHKAADDWGNEDRERIKGTTWYILGGTIGTTGYTGSLLPIIAANRFRFLVRSLQGKDAPDVTICSPHIDSALAGALGASLSLHRAWDAVTAAATRVYKEGRVPLLPLVDIGGTKTLIILAYLDTDSSLRNEAHATWRIPTPHVPPDRFYDQLAAVLAPIVSDSAGLPFSVLPFLGVGQPGRFDDRGQIVQGAHDLGPEFLGCVPAELLRNALARAGSGQVEVWVENDGLSQFCGLARALEREDPQGWQELRRHHGNRVVYFGIGTGLGAGYGELEAGGELMLYDQRNAYDVRADAVWEQPPPPRFLTESLVRVPYEYGNLVSNRFILRYIQSCELRLLHDAVVGHPSPFFLPFTPLVNAPPPAIEAALTSADEHSPFDAGLVNLILDGDTVAARVEKTISNAREELEHQLANTLQSVTNELGETLIAQVRRDGTGYRNAIEAVEMAKRRDRTICFLGTGKSQSIAENLAYIYRNLGIHSLALELTGANSENLTHVRLDDVVFLISNSGRTSELLQLVRPIRAKGCTTIALTGDPQSPLAHRCDLAVIARVAVNPSPISEAPTTSTTAALAVGSAIGIVVSYRSDYDPQQFFADHPCLEFDVDFRGVKADRSFDPVARVVDILRQLAGAVARLLEDAAFTEQMICLTTRILTSHELGRRVFLTGSGSSLRVAGKVAATLTSVGIDAVAVNPAQLPHGDFAHIRPGDLLILISFSGGTRQLIRICDFAVANGVLCAAITANGDSILAQRVNSTCVVTAQDADDSRLATIPDQKLLSSFVNLTVGDALAVMLAHLTRMTDEQFAGHHPGGAIARKTGAYDTRVLTQVCEDRIADICDIHAAHVAKDRRHLMERLQRDWAMAGQGLEPPVAVLGQELNSYYSSQVSTSRREVLVVGMGAIGLAYLGPMLSRQGYRLHFMERNRERMEAMRYQERSGYDVMLCGAGSSGRQEVNGISIIDASDIGRMGALGLRIDTVFMAVGLDNLADLALQIAYLVQRRYAYRIERPINFVFNENFAVSEDPLAALRHNVRDRLGSPEIEVYFDEFVGLVPAIDEAVVPTPAVDDKVVRAEEGYPPLFIDQTQWKGCVPFDAPRGAIRLTNSFQSLHLRKLYVHNMGHALIAYLGHFRGHRMMCAAAADREIMECVRRAMLTICSTLYRRWQYEAPYESAERYVNWRIERYVNDTLADTVQRVGRDPIRKLRPSDRLVGALNYVARFAIPPVNVAMDILIGIVAAMHYAIDVQATRDDYATLCGKVSTTLEVDSRYLRRAETLFNDLVARKPERENVQA